MTFTSSMPKTVGERIVWARKRKGMSQIQLAERIGTSQRHISRMETNKTKMPRQAMREKLGAALDQEPAFFANGDDDEEADPLAGLSLDDVLRTRIRQMLNEERSKL